SRLLVRAAERREQIAGFQELAPDVFERRFEAGLGGPRRWPSGRPRRQCHSSARTIRLERKEARRVGRIGGGDTVVGGARSATQQLLDAADRIAFLIQT